MTCAAPLGEHTGQVREERKVVSVLFCDLVGSTAAAHSADPEDVRRVLGEYHSTVRGEIERYGGVVEKFIGDAAVGVWGVPQAYEDDAERAVRAALAILDAISLDVRIAINTGEVLATLDPAIDAGIGVVGDVVNTAARLQGAAPIRGILAGEGTVRATRRAIEFEELEPLVLKGKPDPVPAWRVVATSAVGHSEPRTPFVGRHREAELLNGILDRTLEGRSVQLVSVIGEPGIGKSRLVAEFERSVNERGVGSCLRGRCLAYGDGFGFWPLGEAVKQHLGLNERDSSEHAQQRLYEAVSGMPDSEWLRARLAPLVGLEGEGGERDEVFAAWQRFLEEIAGRSPLVLILEDLHWAHAAMLAFVQYLAEWSTDVPLLVVGTARPELFEAHPQWAGGLANATTLALRPLDQTESIELATSLLGRVLTSTSAKAALVERCGGNPLFAEEYARLLGERNADAAEGWDMPETVQALIAARIDTLSMDRKDLLHDAAVIGKTFWAGAVAQIGQRDLGAVRKDLHELARKELVRRARQSGVPGEEEYSFWHDLVHQVAYEQIPRTQRGSKHERAAEWIERVSNQRLGDRAEVIAHHYVQALSLTRQADTRSSDALRQKALRFLAMAGERAVGLDVEHAIELLRQALELADAESVERGRILCLIGTAKVLVGRFDEAVPILEDALAAAEAAGDINTIGAVYFQEAEALYFGGKGEEYRIILDRAISRLDGEPPTGEYAVVLASAAFGKLTRNDSESAERLIDRAVDMATSVDERFAYACAVDIRGLLRVRLGDDRAISDFESAIEDFRELGSPYMTMAMTHLGGALHNWYGPARAEETLRASVSHGGRIRNATYEADAHLWDIDRLFDQGRWDELLESVDHVAAWAEAKGSSSAAAIVAAVMKARVLALRGDYDAALAISGGHIDEAFAFGDEDAVWALTSCSAVEWVAQERGGRTHELLTGITTNQITSISPIAEITRLLVQVDAADQARTVLDAVPAGPPKFWNNATSARAVLAEASGERMDASRLFAEAVDRWRAFGNPYELAHALAGQARCAIGSSGFALADSAAAEATAMFSQLGVVERARLLPGPHRTRFPTAKAAVAHQRL